MKFYVQETTTEVCLVAAQRRKPAWLPGACLGRDAAEPIEDIAATAAIIITVSALPFMGRYMRMAAMTMG